MIEGAGKLDRLRVQGNRAEISVLGSGWSGPVSVVQVGETAWVLEGQLSSLFNPKRNGKPHPFRIYAVPLEGGD